MKKIFLIILIFFSITCVVEAQCFDFYIKTPNNSNIKACNVSYPSWAIQQADADTRPYAITVYDSGTSSYNCHAYAWHVKEGGNKVWINNMSNEAGNLNAFWNDGSYILYNKKNNLHMENLKVFYGSTYLSDDHSAITTSDSNVFISKMGAGVLASHVWNGLPFYDHSNLKYYIRTPVISGSTPICCNSTQSFSASNWQSGYYWDKSNNLVSISNPNNSTTNISVPNSNVSGEVKISVKESGGKAAVLRPQHLTLARIGMVILT